MSQKLEKLEPAALGSVFQGRLGLIIGPASTVHPGILSEMSANLATKFGVKPGISWTATADAVMAKSPEQSIAVKQFIRSFFSTQRTTPFVEHLAQVRWRAAFSAALDSFFEDRFTAELERRPYKDTLSVLIDSTPPPPRTIPVFKLLGSTQRNQFVSSDAEYLKWRTRWRAYLRTFADLVKNAPVFCTGMADCPWVLFDLLAEMDASGQPPNTLLLLSDDSIANNPKLLQMLDARTRVLLVQGTIGTISQAINNIGAKKFTPQVGASGVSLPIPSPLRNYDDLVVSVTDSLKTSVSASERARLHNILFSPSVPKWEPFVYDLDFKRTIGEELRKSLLALAGPGMKDTSCVLTGRAGSGKTMTMKRLAFDLAKAGQHVLWIRPSFYQNNSRVFFQFAKDFATHAKPGSQSVFVFMDEPLAHGSLSARDIVAAFKQASLSLVLVVAARTSEWSVRSQDDFVGPLSIDIERDLPDRFNEQELADLPKYLVMLGAFASEAEAKQRIADHKLINAADALSMIYWLLPETRANITSSIKDEYFRLGDSAAFTKIILGATQGTSEVLKSAYELVAVSDYYRTPLPVEVLVSALGVTYQEWIDASAPNGPAWGLLYSDSTEDNSTIVYRTRNMVVTRTIVDALNGGSLGKTGELRALRRLIAACGGTQPVYREFCLGVFLRNEAFESLDFQEGMQLLDEALSTLPFPDRTLAHQRALWIKNHGRDPVQAVAALKQALTTDPYPFAQKSEATEHIHTSIAATILDGIESGVIPITQGKDEALHHLAKARSAKFLNPSAIHVQANLAAALASKLGENERSDVYQLVARAMADLDQTLLTIKPGKKQAQENGEVHILEQVREKLLIRYADEGELRAQAEQVWSAHQSQQGFVLLGRKLLYSAQKEEKGKEFNSLYQFIKDTMARIRSSGGAVSGELHELAAHVLYRWKVHVPGAIKSREQVDWTGLYEHAVEGMRAASNTGTVLLRYIQALSMAQLSKWPDSNALFTQLRQHGVPRDLLWEHRDWLVGDNNLPRKVQGLVSTGAGRQFLHAEDLDTDFPLDRKDTWPRDGEMTHAYISISFGGLTATSSIK
jgi:hypothetical protein